MPAARCSLFGPAAPRGSRVLPLPVLVLGDDAQRVRLGDRLDGRRLVAVRDAVELVARVDELRPEGGGDEPAREIWGDMGRYGEIWWW